MNVLTNNSKLFSFIKEILSFFQKNTMMEADKEKIRQMINLALKNEMSWISLAFFCHDLTPDPVKSKLVVEVLLEELQILQNKECKCIGKKSGEVKLPINHVDVQPISNRIAETEHVSKIEDVSIQDFLSKLNPIPENLLHSRYPYQHFEVESLIETENVGDNEDEYIQDPFVKFEPIKEDLHSEANVIEEETFETNDNKDLDLQNQELEDDELKEFSNDDPLEFYSKQVFRHQCKTCKSVFESNWKLKRHETIHSGEKPFKCRFCPKKFRLSDGLKQHQKRHAKLILEKRKYLGCNTCNKTFKDAKSLEKHNCSHKD